MPSASISFRYALGVALSLPLVPLLYVDARRVRKSVPRLPEAAQPAGTAGNRANPPFRVLVIGESTMAGVGVATHEEGFAGSLARELANKLNRSVSWQVVAKSGYSAKQVCSKLVPRLPTEPADLIVVGLGGNDAFELNTPRRWARDCSQLIAALRTQFLNAPIAFANMPPVSSFPAFSWSMQTILGGLVNLHGDALAETVKNHTNVYYNAGRITLSAWIERTGQTLSPADYFSDGVHPAPITYQTWAADFAEFLATNHVVAQPEP